MTDDAKLSFIAELFVAKLAKEYIRTRDQERGFRAHRNRLTCHHMAPMQDEEGMAPATHPDGGAWQRHACWTIYHERTADGYGATSGPFGDGSDRGWCEGCRQRQTAHAALLRAVRARVAALARLRAAVARAGVAYRGVSDDR